MDSNSKIIGVYKIVYYNGFVQYKNLISYDDYVNIIKPTWGKIDVLSVTKDGKAEAQELKAYLKAQFGTEFFFTGSPLHEAIATGVIQLDKPDNWFKMEYAKEYYEYKARLTLVTEPIVLQEVETEE